MWSIRYGQGSVGGSTILLLAGDHTCPGDSGESLESKCNKRAYGISTTAVVQLAYPVLFQSNEHVDSFAFNYTEMSRPLTEATYC